jgi:hypothetical protein
MPVGPTIHDWGEAGLVSLTTALLTFLSFIPALIGAIIILVIGWIPSGFLRPAGGDCAEPGRLSRRDQPVYGLIAELVKWFIRLVFLEVAARALHLAAVTTLLNTIVLFIPNLVVALLIVMLGMLAARFVGGLVRGAVASSGMANPQLMGNRTEWGSSPWRRWWPSTRWASPHAW